MHAELTACVHLQTGVENAHRDRMALQQQAEKRDAEIQVLKAEARLAHEAKPLTAPGGLPLEALREVLRAFQTVLQPQLPALLAVPPEARSPSLAQSLQYLSSCRDQVATTASGPVG